MTDPIDIAAIDAMLAAITQGEWEVTGKTGDGKAIFVESDMNRDNWNCCRCEIDSDDCNSEMAMANARFIAGAPRLVQRLRDEVVRLRAELSEWKPWFICPNCRGVHFGTKVTKDADGSAVVTDIVHCHDQHGVGCDWRGRWPQETQEPTH